MDWIGRVVEFDTPPKWGGRLRGVVEGVFKNGKLKVRARLGPGFTHITRSKTHVFHLAQHEVQLCPTQNLAD